MKRKESLETVVAKEHEHYRADTTPFVDRIFRSSVFFGFATVSKMIRHFTTEHFSEEGLQEVFNKQEGIKPPYLLLVQHSTWYDFSNIFPLWFAFPNEHIFTALTRKDYFPKIPLVNALANWLASAVSLPVYGISSEKAASAEETERRRRINKEVQEHVVDAYAKGISLAIAPEGTSKGNGRISPLRSGAYHYSHFAIEEGQYTVPCVPLGVTYDFLSGNGIPQKRKQRVFVRIGKPFFYTPVTMKEIDAASYKQRDKAMFNKRIREAFIDLNTITAAQLGAVFFYERLQKGERRMTIGQFLPAICATVDALKHEEDVRFDSALLDSAERYQLIYRLYNALIAEGYLVHENGSETTCSASAQRVPSLVAYKQENPLLYAYNKIAEVMEERPRIKTIIMSGMS